MKINIIILGLIFIFSLILTGCSQEELTGKAELVFADNTNGTFKLTMLDSDGYFNPLYMAGSSNVIDLPAMNPMLLTTDLVFREGYVGKYRTKLQICEISAYNHTECDVAQFAFIRNGNNVQVTREECSDCKKGLNIIKDLSLQVGK